MRACVLEFAPEKLWWQLALTHDATNAAASWADRRCDRGIVGTNQAAAAPPKNARSNNNQPVAFNCVAAVAQEQFMRTHESRPPERITGQMCAAVPTIRFGGPNEHRLQVHATEIVRRGVAKSLALAHTMGQI